MFGGSDSSSRCVLYRDYEYTFLHLSFRFVVLNVPAGPFVAHLPKDGKQGGGGGGGHWAVAVLYLRTSKYVCNPIVL